MAPNVKVRLEVEGAPEAVAAFRAVAAQIKSAGNDAAGGLGTMGKALENVTKLFAAVKLLELASQVAQFTAETIKLAAEQKDLAGSLGTTVGHFSALSAVARATNTEQSRLVSGLGALANRIDDLRAGVPAATESFRRLGLSAKDFAGEDIAKHAETVSRAFTERVGPGFTKGAIAADVMGKNGRALLPVLDKLRELGGLAGSVEFAKQSGFYVDAATVSKLDALAASMQQMQAGARGLALDFALGFGPGVLASVKALTQQFGSGRSAALAMGEGLGVLARGMARLILHTVAWGTVLGDVFTLKWGKAREDFARFDEMLKQLEQDTAIRPFDDATGSGGGASDAAAAARAKEAAAKRLALSKRLHDAQVQEDEAGERAREASEKASYERGLMSLEEYFSKRRARLNADFSKRQVELERQIQTASGFELQILVAQLATLRAQWRTAGIELDSEFRAAQKPVRTLADDIRGPLTSALSSFLANGINQVHNLIDAFRQLGLSIASALQSAASAKIAQFVIDSIPFLTGSSVKAGGKAMGGLLSGPGSGTSDSIPIWASAGEFIMPAHRVAAPGMLAALEAVRAGSLDLSRLGSINQSLRPMRRYAEGGVVGPIGQAGSASIDGSITIGLAEGLVVQAMESPAGQRALLRVVGKNRRAFGQVVR